MLKTKLFIGLLAIVLLAGAAFAQVDIVRNFLTTAIDVDATVTLTNGSTMTSEEVPVVKDQVALTLEFTAAAGSASTLDIELEGSYRKSGTSGWSIIRNEAATPIIQVATNTDVITGTTVRVTYIMNVYGIKRLRIRSVHNSDAVNNVTEVQLTLSEK